MIQLELPDGSAPTEAKVLLHACCAPCSAAIVECMLRNGMMPTVYFSNANIYPQEEYDIRKHELMRFLKEQNVPYVEDEYDHQAWLRQMKGLEQEPERGARCTRCFEFRLAHAARYAADGGFTFLTTTLASSRWKDIDQINTAGRQATATFPSITFWEQNWRKGGLQVRRGELLKLNNFYNQQYCGCEFSRARLTAQKHDEEDALATSNTTRTNVTDLSLQPWQQPPTDRQEKLSNTNLPVNLTGLTCGNNK